MRELHDYSGEFNPNLRLTDFSKEALIRLLVSASKAYLGIDGVWTTLMRQKYGDRAAFDFDKEVWFGKALGLDIKRTVEPLNIQGNDIATLFKYWQCTPGGAVIYTGPSPDFEPHVKFELKNKNLGIMTYERCYSLEYFERHGDGSLQKLACEEIDLPAWEWLAHKFNPNIRVRPLKMP
ncbi:MAG: DUF6125 family protein, partial [Chloroflexi bacterium]|nr:DUF6125 family protein [Chloroflexota bacterium]